MRLDKTKRNRKYQYNNRIIQKVIIGLNKSHRWHITLKQIINKTKLTKHTLYSHYPDIDNALNTIESELIHEYKDEISHGTASLAKIVPDKNRRLFYITMLHMSKNKDVFIAVCDDIANYTLLYKMIEEVYPMLDITWFPLSSPAPSVGNERADMYISMCVEILSKWGYKTSCNIHKADRYINRLLRITSDASMRCR